MKSRNILFLIFLVILYAYSSFGSKYRHHQHKHVHRRSTTTTTRPVHHHKEHTVAVQHHKSKHSKQTPAHAHILHALAVGHTSHTHHRDVKHTSGKTSSNHHSKSVEKVPAYHDAHHAVLHQPHHILKRLHTVTLNAARTQHHEPMTVCGQLSSEQYCRCAQHTVDCNGAKLHTTNIKPSSDNMVVKNLKMQHNSLTHLMPEKIIPGHEDELTKLDLSYNELRIVSTDTFSGMYYLEMLHLSYNHIKNIENGAFNSLEISLKDLRLEHNELTNITRPIFRNLTNLEYLSLDFNPLKTVNAQTFMGLRHLRELSLRFTDLSFVEKDWFQEMHMLETLDLRGAHFHVMPTLMGMDRLKVLDVSLNPILDLSPHSFYTMPHLRKLYMVHMPELTNIEDCAFCGLRFLDFLEIRNCSKLVQIHRDAFSDPGHFMNSLSLIDLSDNALDTFYEYMLPWANASSIKLAGNPLACDCRVKWIHDMLNDDTTFPKFQDGVPTCAQPVHLVDHPISSVHSDEFLCSYVRISTGRVLIAITMSVLIAACAFGVWYMCVTSSAKHTLHSTFKTLPVPKYAYRNLAMKSEHDNDDTVHFVVKNDEPVLL